LTTREVGEKATTRKTATASEEQTPLSACQTRMRLLPQKFLSFSHLAAASRSERADTSERSLAASTLASFNSCAA